MRKGFVLGLVALGFLCLSGYALFMVMPRPRHEEAIARAIAKGSEAFAQAQKGADDPAQNGWLNPTFFPYWGSPSQQSAPDTPVANARKEWGAYTSALEGTRIHHQKLLNEKDPGYLAALAAFEQIAPDLQRAMSTPRFLAPQKLLNAQTVTTNYLSARSLALGLVGLAEVRMVQGKPAEALSLLLPPLNFSKTLRQQNGLHGGALGLSTSKKVADAFIAFFNPRSGLGAADWKKAASSFTEAVPAEDQLLVSTQIEVAAMNATFQEAAAGKPVSAELEEFRKVPGMLGRERRIYNNVLGEVLENLQAGRPVVYDYEAEARPVDLLAGKVGFSAEAPLPTVAHQSGLIGENRKTLAGLAVTSGVAAYLAEKKALPPDLKAVRAVATIPADAILTELGLTYKAEGGKATISLPQAKGFEPNDGPSLYGPHPWFQKDKDLIVWTI